MGEPKIIFRMVAHNSEATIARAIESVLAQTYTNLEAHVAVRASADSTADIAGEYAEKDTRVRVIINKQAFEYDEGNDIKDYYHEYDIDNTYVCFMDGDDEYKPDFLEKMVPFAEDNNLDIAACGNEVIDSQTGAVINEIKLDKPFIIQGEDFNTNFPVYHFYMRTRWGKLYKMPLIPKLDKSRIFWIFYSDDTVETLEYYRNAKRIGIYPGAFYKWYYTGQSLSYKWDKRRIEVDRTIHKLTLQFLEDKAGGVTPANREFLFVVYSNAVNDTIGVVINAQIGMRDKLNALYGIMSHQYTKELADMTFTTFKQNAQVQVFSQVADWLAKNYTVFNDRKSINMITELISMFEKFQAKYKG